MQQKRLRVIGKDFIQSSMSEISLILRLQLATAMENLKHIFTVPESVRKTEELISEGKLLNAHKQ